MMRRCKDEREAVRNLRKVEGGAEIGSKTYIHPMIVTRQGTPCLTDSAALTWLIVCSCCRCITAAFMSVVVRFISIPDFQ